MELKVAEAQLNTLEEQLSGQKKELKESQDRTGMKFDTLNEYNLRNLINTKKKFVMLLILYVR